MRLENIHINIIGLGYVGLPLAVEFGKIFNTTGVDINESRINELNSGFDKTLELTKEQIEEARMLSFTNKLQPVFSCRNIFIITVPTPIDQFKKPDLRPLLGASSAVGKVLKKDDIVIYESTVFPGCTEEECVPVLELESGMKYNKDFYCGYSPERINPGDKINTLTRILKITSGSNPEIASLIDELYKTIIVAGTFAAPSIKVAEAAKIVENCQRDVNISFVNELALIFDKMGIATSDVLEAAGTKWNFLKFKPGLVGGHCIGGDPYYMIHKAESLGYFPALIGAGRRINDNMGIFVANKVIKLMIREGVKIKGSKVLIMGFTFKENCPDIRNTRVIDIYNELIGFELEVDIYDPYANANEVLNEYGIGLVGNLNNKYNAIVIAVEHQEFKELSNFFLESISLNNLLLFDIKGVKNSADFENHWKL